MRNPLFHRSDTGTEAASDRQRSIGRTRVNEIADDSAAKEERDRSSISRQVASHHEQLQVIQGMADASPRGRALIRLQRLADHFLGAAAGTRGRQASVVNRFKNVWPLEEQKAIEEVLPPEHEHLTSEEVAHRLMTADAPVFVYGREPATDEQIEILGSASYLRRRKMDWRAELQARENAKSGNGQQRAEKQPSWEAFQAACQDLEPKVNDPWFLQSTYGYKVSGNEELWLTSSTGALLTPDPSDPQQLLGKTYDRDTSITSQSRWLTPEIRVVNGDTPAATLASSTQSIFRVFDNSDQMNVTCELRFARGSFSQQSSDSYVVTGTVVETPHFHNGGFKPETQIRCEKSSSGCLDVFEDTDTACKKRFNHGWAGKLESQVYFNAVTLAEDALGVRFQKTAKARNRGDQPKLDNALVAELKTRYDTSPLGTVSDNELSLKRSLGPSRNRLNIESLDWSISVAQYRRLGGDIIFTEAPHPGRDVKHYSNLIRPAAEVNVTDGQWYHDAQEHQKDRFIGGRSNSTLLYLKTASVLYQQNTLTKAQCLDVMAFVVADMVVSGEHSLPECMTSIVMAAERSPPWKDTALNIGQAASAMATWRLLIDQATLEDMRTSAKDKLVSQLGTRPMDFKLIKALVGLCKAIE